MKMSVRLNNKWMLCVLVGLSSVKFASAGQFYVYKDQNGSTLLTNHQRNDHNLTKVKVTYYPDSNIHHYSNWGSTEAAVAPSFSKNKNAFDDMIRQAAQSHGVAEGLIKAVMHTESGFNINARSPVGALGLMQLMPATAKRFNVSNAYDPQQNISAGAKYLSWLLKRFNGDTHLALAAYNAGEGNVSKYGGIPPFRETQDYVRRVSSRYTNLYSGGVGFNSGSNTLASRTSSSAMSTPSPVISNSTPLNSKLQNGRYNRNIVADGNGGFTDAPSGLGNGSYATGNAIASAHIQIEN